LLIHFKSNRLCQSLKIFGRKYPDAGTEVHFLTWIYEPESQPYNSWGNGSAMRVSPIGFAFSTIETVLSEAKKSAEVSHNHPEGIKGAQAAACAIFLGSNRRKQSENIRQKISERFGYNLKRTIDDIRPLLQL
jgi:ADP-ribosylglycohydrolase